MHDGDTAIRVLQLIDSQLNYWVGCFKWSASQDAGEFYRICGIPKYQMGI